ncbi:hypothetical protein [Pannonibacter carbonis]|uniref:hypothetical protein n=1 Tax=Pannonibacter carbonis TaxID=2067569 RepID=UPI0013002A12|nr:hypothetical protein [Pannonibacter carbonis]
MNRERLIFGTDNPEGQEMQNQLDHRETVAGIRKGLKQARAGEGIEAGQFFDELPQLK